MTTSIPIAHLFVIREYFKNEDCSDKVLHIIEIGDDVKPQNLRGKEEKETQKQRDANVSSPTRKRSKRGESSNSNTNNCTTDTSAAGDIVLTKVVTPPIEPKTYSVFPVHSLILCINSSYFKSLILNSGMKETTQKDIIIKVNKGKGKYLELLINSFYDPSMLSNLDVLDLLQLLETGDMFLSDPVIIHGLHLLKRMKITSVDDWQMILQHMQQFQTMGSVPTTETYTVLRHNCSDFLVKTFCGLESNLEKHSVFNEMSFICLKLLLASKKPFLFHENSLIHFVLTWLTFDVERQTDENISILVNECCYEQMSPMYLTKYLSPKQPILSKWCGWVDWHYKAVCHHALSNSKTVLPEIHIRKGHIFKDNNNKVEQCVMKFSYTLGEDSLKQWTSYYNQIVFEGFLLTPELVMNKSDSDKYDVMIHMYLDVFCKESSFEMFYFQCDIAFAIFPYAGCYSRNLFTKYDFATQHYRRTRMVFHKNNLVTISAGTVDEALFTKFMLDGMSVAFAFKSCERQWPNFGKAFSLVSSWPESPLDRKLSMYLMG